MKNYSQVHRGEKVLKEGGVDSAKEGSLGYSRNNEKQKSGNEAEKDYL